MDFSASSDYSGDDGSIAQHSFIMHHIGISLHSVAPGQGDHIARRVPIPPAPTKDKQTYSQLVLPP